ncbi:single insulin-like growth factor-binding domain protein-1 [Centruroides vittatus]|uniref:single insulin-like growth factor-binding domain protein-1 n=1 Tax=Centruroides vittatus TaxID=120091 RepID=UPI00350FBDB9
MNVNSLCICSFLLFIGVKCQTETTINTNCNEQTCQAAPEDCSSGFVTTSCGCTVCAQSEGDECGGFMNEYGQCGDGMYCVKTTYDSSSQCISYDAGDDYRGICKRGQLSVCF